MSKLKKVKLCGEHAVATVSLLRGDKIGPKSCRLQNFEIFVVFFWKILQKVNFVESFIYIFMPLSVRFRFSLDLIKSSHSYPYCWSCFSRFSSTSQVDSYCNTTDNFLVFKLKDSPFQFPSTFTESNLVLSFQMCKKRSFIAVCNFGKKFKLSHLDRELLNKFMTKKNNIG